MGSWDGYQCALSKFGPRSGRGSFYAGLAPLRAARDPEAMPAQGYRGSRYSFGDACPNLADQKQLLVLLNAEDIGITLSEEDKLDPEQSTSAIVVHHTIRRGYRAFARPIFTNER
jgi:cobalamin-dependent methionine synthase I